MVVVLILPCRATILEGVELVDRVLQVTKGMAKVALIWGLVMWPMEAVTQWPFACLTVQRDSCNVIVVKDSRVRIHFDYMYLTYEKDFHMLCNLIQPWEML